MVTKERDRYTGYDNNCITCIYIYITYNALKILKCLKVYKNMKKQTIQWYLYAHEYARLFGFEFFFFWFSVRVPRPSLCSTAGGRGGERGKCGNFGLATVGVVTNVDRVMRGTGLVDDSVEPVVVVSGVRHLARGAIRFHKTVLALDHVTVSLFPLVLHVAGVVVLYAVVERVLGRRLQHTKSRL